MLRGMAKDERSRRWRPSLLGTFGGPRGLNRTRGGCATKGGVWLRKVGVGVGCGLKVEVEELRGKRQNQVVVNE